MPDMAGEKNAKGISVFQLVNGLIKYFHISVLHMQIISDHRDVEKIGTENIYKHMKNQEVNIGIHAHDRNLSINTLIREECESESHNDTWHVVKSMKSALKKYHQDRHI